MKFIAKINDRTYLAEVTTDEIQKFHNTYYRGQSGIEVGVEIDLSKGYDHAQEIRLSVEAMQKICVDVEKITSAVKIGKAVKISSLKQKINEAAK